MSGSQNTTYGGSTPARLVALSDPLLLVDAVMRLLSAMHASGSPNTTYGDSTPERLVVFA